MIEGLNRNRVSFLELLLPLMEKEKCGMVVFGLDLFSEGGLQLISFNKSFTKITGYHLEELFGSSIDNFIKKIFQDKRRFSLERVAVNSTFVKIFLTKMGKSRHAEISWSLVLRDNGQLLHLILKLSDITRKENARKKAEQSIHEARYLSRHDSLTGLLNRRAANEYWDALCINRRKDRLIESAAILMVDVNQFKKINDKHSHEVGDKCLFVIAEIIAQHFRSEETFRWGGDEFLIIMANASQDIVELKIKQIKQEVESYVFRQEALRDIRLSISIGFSVETDLRANKILGEALHSADVRMYQDKEESRQD